MTSHDPRDNSPPPLPLSLAAAALKPKATAPETAQAAEKAATVGETGGSKGPEPTRFGDWERKGRCSDF